jgi:hypothetical protein
VPEWAPEGEQPEAGTAELERAPEFEAEVPEAESSEPEASPEAAEIAEAGAEPEPAEPGAV